MAGREDTSLDQDKSLLISDVGCCYSIFNTRLFGKMLISYQYVDLNKEIKDFDSNSPTWVIYGITRQLLDKKPTRQLFYFRVQTGGWRIVSRYPNKSQLKNDPHRGKSVVYECGSELPAMFEQMVDITRREYIERNIERRLQYIEKRLSDSLK